MFIPPPVTRVAIYARYSSDLQNPSSVDDQVALCRRLVASQFGEVADRITVYSDAAITGQTMGRPGLSSLIADASAERFDLVVSEGLDRISRKLKDIAGIYEILKYHRVGIWTAHEGHVTEMHIAFKGTMNALYVQDMGDKMKRGQTARITAGFAISSCPYGYKIARGRLDEHGRLVSGVREIDEAEAVIVRRIFREFASGKGVVGIIRGLNADGIPGIDGRPWLRRTLAGRIILEEGILRNEMYLGRLIYNKRLTLRDPITGKKRFRIQPKGSWTRVDVPHLRIVSDELWNAVRARLDQISHPTPPKRKLPIHMKTHNQHALTGWVRCGQCGGPKSIANDSRYVCNGCRFERSCRNSRGTKEPVLIEEVFTALFDRVRGGQNFRPVFLRIFAQQMDHSAELRAEEADVAAQIGRYLDAIGAGVDKDQAVVRILDLQARQKVLREQLSRMLLPDLPDEADIRSRLLREIMALKSGAIADQRLMFGHLLKAITLTPIPDKARGETVAVELREDGWPEFWRSIPA
jgi:site-specific DNA recombinase